MQEDKYRQLHVDFELTNKGALTLSKSSLLDKDFSNESLTNLIAFWVS